MRATTAICTGCVQRGMGQTTPNLSAWRHKCCQRRPMTQHTPAEHRGAHWKQNLCHWAASL